MLAPDLAGLAAGALGLVDELDLLAARAAQQHLARRLGQLLEGGIDVEAVVARHALEQREGVGIAPVPALDRAARQAERGKGDHPVGVEHRRHAEAAAGRAGADRRVEREQARLELRERVVAERAGELAREQVFSLSRLRERAGVRVPDRGTKLDRERPAVGDAQRRLVAFGQPLLDAWLDPDPVDDDVDVVLLRLLQLRHVGRLDRLAVDPEAHVALRLHVGEQVGELALPVAHHRREDHEAGVGGQGERRVDHLADALRLQRQIVVGAVRRAGAGVEQAQVVVDLGDGADGRSRVVRGRLLLDRDRGREALDHVDVGLVHQLQELPRIGREALDVAALAFGVERVEGEARLARAREAGDDDQAVPRDVEVDVLQVVGARAADPDQGGAPVAGGGASLAEVAADGLALGPFVGGQKGGLGGRHLGREKANRT